LLDEYDGLIALAASKAPNERLFPWCRQRVDQFMRKYAKEAGLHPSKRHHHVWKHSLALLVMDKTQQIGCVASILGHRAMSSSMIYLREADERKAFAAVQGITL
jgi:site-specific recombinase XerD